MILATSLNAGENYYPEPNRHSNLSIIQSGQFSSKNIIGQNNGVRNMHPRSVLDNYDSTDVRKQMPVISGSHAAKNFKKMEALTDKQNRGASSRLSVGVGSHSNQVSSGHTKRENIPHIGTKSSSVSGRQDIQKR